MTPRPLLLVADADAVEGRKLHGSAEQVIVREGYLVMHCDPEQLQMFKLLAPHPFTAADVAELRTVRDYLHGEDARDTAARLTSIAERIEDML